MIVSIGPVDFALATIASCLEVPKVPPKAFQNTEGENKCLFLYPHFRRWKWSLTRARLDRMVIRPD